MKQFSNRYIFIFSSVMVIIVATILSLAAMALKPLQDKNEEIAKKTDILKSIYQVGDLSEVKNKDQYIKGQYKKYIVESYVIDINGNKKEGIDAFKVDLKKELAKEGNKRNLPVFISQLDNGEEKLIIPLRGKGLWGPIWGYISLNEDNNTIFGAVFDHKTETPGLGAEINTSWFQKPFKDKKLFNENGEFVSIKVYKGGKGAAANAGDLIHGVDAISGGTITSKGLEAMLRDNLKTYVTFLKNNQ
ncbi:MAG: NADH:ubiquinone reductase (Na(+)-transporting) subunit C [Bacteroidales bacterium]|nr:NADH:ubiquinone reductase (Na(+)-transporting) subunit C [Bacteroidales bacterium]